MTQKLIAVSMILLAITAYAGSLGYAEGLDGSAYVQGGYDTLLVMPYATLGGELWLWRFAIHGSVRTDFRGGGEPFKPVRNIYDIGTYFEWEWLRIGYYHECTHFEVGEPETLEDIKALLPLYRPNINEFYIKVTIGG